MGALRGEYRGAVLAIRDAVAADFERVFELLAAYEKAGFGASELEREQIAHEWAQTALDRWVASVDGDVVGYVGLDAAQTLDLAAVDMAAARALLAEAELRARERGFAHLACTTAAADAPLRLLLERSGFRREGGVLRMWREVDGGVAPASWPHGFSVRTYRDADSRRVQNLLDDAYEGWDTHYVKRSPSDWLAWMTGHDGFDPELWFLVEEHDMLVACVLCWREEEGRGWVKDIAVRSDHRGRGLGRALLQHTLHEYAARGAERVGLKVDSSNPTGALELYQRLGFTVDRRYAIWMKWL
jgi:ribosomal protein S18 acetylase RimI-like enzyme